VRKSSFNVNPILVMSIEDLAREWLVLPRALRSGQSLACGLGSSATPARLARIRARTIALNDAIARVCFRNRDCLYDRGTRFRMPVEAGYFSPTALGGLSVAGQRAVTAAEWGPAQILLRHVG
jgi:hypothetical protein